MELRSAGPTQALLQAEEWQGSARQLWGLSPAWSPPSLVCAHPSPACPHPCPACPHPASRTTAPRPRIPHLCAHAPVPARLLAPQPAHLQGLLLPQQWLLRVRPPRARALQLRRRQRPRRFRLAGVPGAAGRRCQRDPQSPMRQPQGWLRGQSSGTERLCHPVPGSRGKRWGRIQPRHRGPPNGAISRGRTCAAAAASSGCHLCPAA